MSIVECTGQGLLTHVNSNHNYNSPFLAASLAVAALPSAEPFADSAALVLSCAAAVLLAAVPALGTETLFNKLESEGVFFSSTRGFLAEGDEFEAVSSSI
jgi:hypothetical protein